jgi:ABC-type multidrug transport system ATPase subunit
MLIINKGKIIADGKPEDLAKLSQKEMILNLEIEGEQIEEKLHALPKIKELKVISEQDKKIKLEIIPETDQSLEPMIAQKIWENKWIVWKLERQESNLEEIFQALTKE